MQVVQVLWYHPRAPHWNRVKCESTSRRFQPGEGPSSRDVLCDYEALLTMATCATAST